MTDLRTYSASGSDRIRRFVLEAETPIAGPGRQRFATPEEAEAHPVAAAVMSVPGVQEVILEGNAVVVLRREDLPWDALEDRISYAIGAALGLGPGGADEAAGEPLPDDEIFALVARILERDINPAVAGHGGKVELLDVQDGTVVVRMMGGCQGCGMANVTLRQGIEAQLRRVIPGLQGLRDITDHTAGENPYFK
ncbi:MAG TPA: NifU family protein [Gemmatimonadales bacterium]|jgi:Fe-S cluster biogenesis protein NfuA